MKTHKLKICCVDFPPERGIEVCMAIPPERPDLHCTRNKGHKGMHHAASTFDCHGSWK